MSLAKDFKLHPRVRESCYSGFGQKSDSIAMKERSKGVTADLMEEGRPVWRLRLSSSWEMMIARPKGENKDGATQEFSEVSH